jgi:hypothetical protein
LNRSLPGVTLCNKNLISREKAFEPHNVPGFEEMLKLFHDNQIQLDDIYNKKGEISEPESPSADKVNPKSEETSRATDLLTNEQEEDVIDIEDDPRTRNESWRKKRKIEIGIYEDFMSAYYTRLPVFRQIKDGPEPHKFLTYLTCNQKDWPEVDSTGNIKASTFNCADKKSIHTAQGKGNCITLFHEASSSSISDKNQEDWSTLNALGNDWQSNVKLTPVRVGREKDFVPLELIKVVLDFGPENYTDLRKEPGGEIIFHDNRSIPLEAQLSYRLEAGKAYTFLLKKSTTRSLAFPYNTNCTDYYGANWIKYQRGEAKLTDVKSLPLSRTHCIEQCVLQKVIPKSSCWPKQIPFVASAASLAQQEHSLAGKSQGSSQSLRERGNLYWCHRQNSCKYSRRFEGKLLLFSFESSNIFIYLQLIFSHQSLFFRQKCGFLLFGNFRSVD